MGKKGKLFTAMINQFALKNAIMRKTILQQAAAVLQTGTKFLCVFGGDHVNTPRVMRQRGGLSVHYSYFCFYRAPVVMVRWPLLQASWGIVF